MHNFYQRQTSDNWGAYYTSKLKDLIFQKNHLQCINIYIRPYVYDYSHQAVITLQNLPVLKI